MSYGSADTGFYGSASNYVLGGEPTELETATPKSPLDLKWFVYIAGGLSIACLIAIIVITIMIVVNATSQAKETMITKIPLLKKRISSHAIDQRLADSMIGL
jgi:hypothetical protein